MSTDAPPTTPTRSQRLDRLPFTREHGRLVGGSGIGGAAPGLPEQRGKTLEETAA